VYSDSSRYSKSSRFDSKISAILGDVDVDILRVINKIVVNENNKYVKYCFYSLFGILVLNSCSLSESKMAVDYIDPIIGAITYGKKQRCSWVW